MGFFVISIIMYIWLVGMSSLRTVPWLDLSFSWEKFNSFSVMNAMEISTGFCRWRGEKWSSIWKKMYSVNHTLRGPESQSICSNIYGCAMYARVRPSAWNVCKEEEWYYGVDLFHRRGGRRLTAVVPQTVCTCVRAFPDRRRGFVLIIIRHRKNCHTIIKLMINLISYIHNYHTSDIL